MKKQKNKKHTMWGIVQFPTELRKKMLAIASVKNITITALMIDICCEFISREEIKELLIKEYDENSDATDADEND